jgi:transcriptional regulator with XRE-family HTH domain
MSMLGAYIKELREKNDLSLRELAKRLGGMSAAFLSDIELGRRYPSDEVLAKMAIQLGVTLEDMKKRDARLPMKELKELVERNPVYGLAFRRVAEEGVSPEDLMKLADDQKSGEPSEGELIELMQDHSESDLTTS